MSDQYQRAAFEAAQYKFFTMAQDYIDDMRRRGIIGQPQIALNDQPSTDAIYDGAWAELRKLRAEHDELVAARQLAKIVREHDGLVPHEIMQALAAYDLTTGGK